MKCGECTTDDDCNNLDKDYCNGSKVMHDEGVCQDFMCTVKTTEVEDCDDYDNAYCDGSLIKEEIISFRPTNPKGIGINFFLCL